MQICILVAGVLLTAIPLPALAAPDDGNPLPYYLDAVARREAGDTAGAVISLEAARAVAPEDPDLALELARAYTAERRYGDAAAAFAEASGLAPDRADLALAQAWFHLSHGFRVAVALDAAERAARLAPTDPSVVTTLDRARTAAALAPWSTSINLDGLWGRSYNRN